MAGSECVNTNVVFGTYFTKFDPRKENGSCDARICILAVYKPAKEYKRFYLSKHHLQTPYRSTYINLSDYCRQPLPASTLILKSSTCNEQRASESRRYQFPASS